jgi:hypothetical protein
MQVKLIDQVMLGVHRLGICGWMSLPIDASASRFWGIWIGTEVINGAIRDGSAASRRAGLRTLKAH